MRILISIKQRRKNHALTLLELLVILGVLFILATMLIPVSGPQRPAKKMKARAEIAYIVTAIEAYKQDYGRYPVSTNIETAALASKADFTYGGPELNTILGSGANTPPNRDVMAILMDITKCPDGTPTVNADHNLNPKQITYLNAKPSGDTNSPGVGNDLVYRDPWGHPYIISLDLNGDNHCHDAFHKKQPVTQSNGSIGYNGLFNSSDTNGTSDAFELNRPVMVWSLGPDGKADVSKPSNSPPNKDNVLSWQ